MCKTYHSIKGMYWKTLDLSAFLSVHKRPSIQVRWSKEVSRLTKSFFEGDGQFRNVANKQINLPESKGAPSECYDWHNLKKKQYILELSRMVDFTNLY